MVMMMVMILQVEMKPGVGPVFDKPLVSPADLESLTNPDVKVCLNPGHLLCAEINNNFS